MVVIIFIVIIITSLLFFFLLLVYLCSALFYSAVLVSLEEGTKKKRHKLNARLVFIYVNRARKVLFFLAFFTPHKLALI